MPVVVQRQAGMALTLQKTVEVPQLQFLHGCGRPCEMQRQVPGSSGRCLRTVHRQDLQVLRRSDFCLILRHFSHSVRLDVSAHFEALDDEEFFVVEGSGWPGRRESDFQVFCHSNWVHASAFTDEHDRRFPSSAPAPPLPAPLSPLPPPLTLPSPDG